MPSTGFYVCLTGEGGGPSDLPIAHTEDEELSTKLCEELPVLIPEASNRLRVHPAGHSPSMAWDEFLQDAADLRTTLRIQAEDSWDYSFDFDWNRYYSENLDFVDHLRHKASMLLDRAAGPLDLSWDVPTSNAGDEGEFPPGADRSGNSSRSSKKARRTSGSKKKTGRPPLDAAEQKKRREFAGSWKRDHEIGRKLKDTCAAFGIEYGEGRKWLEWVRTHPPEK